MATKKLTGILGLDNVGFVRGIKSSIAWSKQLATELKNAGLAKGTGLLAMKGLDSGLQAISSSLRQLGGVAKNALGVFSGIQLGNLAGQAVNFAKGSVQAAAATEDWSAKFTVLTGNAELAGVKIRNLNKFAEDNGKPIAEVRALGMELEKLGGAALDNPRMLKRIGDAAEATTGDMAALGSAVAHAYASLREGKGISSEVATLRDSGIFGEGAQASAKEAQINALANRPGHEKEAWAELTKSLDKFDGQMDKTAGNYNRRLEKMEAETNVFQQQIGKNLIESTSGVTGWITGVLKAHNGSAGIDAARGMGEDKVERRKADKAAARKALDAFNDDRPKHADIFGGVSEAPRHVDPTLGKIMMAEFEDNRRRRISGAGKPWVAVHNTPLSDFRAGGENSLATHPSAFSAAGGYPGASILSREYRGGLNAPAARAVPSFLRAGERRKLENRERAQIQAFRLAHGQAQYAPGEAVRAGDRARVRNVQRQTEREGYAEKMAADLAAIRATLDATLK